MLSDNRSGEIVKEIVEVIKANEHKKNMIKMCT